MIQKQNVYIPIPLGKVRKMDLETQSIDILLQPNMSLPGVFPTEEADCERG